MSIKDAPESSTCQGFRPLRMFGNERLTTVQCCLRLPRVLRGIFSTMLPADPIEFLF
jgi:hypothetical protein